MRPILDNYKPQPGTPIRELDTPCFIVDMDALDNNLRVAADTYRDTACKMRLHTKNLKSPFLARRQIEAGGTVGGVCTAKVSEAEVMVEGGIFDILIPNQIVTSDKIDRLCSLAKKADMKVCVTEARNLRDLSERAVANRVALGVLIEVDTSMGRGGVRTTADGVELARLAVKLPGVEFRGVMSHQHIDGYADKETRERVGRTYIQICLDVKDAIEAEGIPVEMVSSGETFSYDVAPKMPGVTEVEGGTYALMGTELEFMDEFRIAGKVLTTVVSTPRPGVAIGDVGTRAICPLAEYDWWPSVEGIPGITVEKVLDEHIVLKSEGAMPLEVGDQLLLLPGYQDGLVNRWDRFVAVRDGVVEGLWDIPGRGCFQ